MSKGTKRCYFCKCLLNSQNKDSVTLGDRRSMFESWVWVDCCHRCKAKHDKS